MSVINTNDFFSLSSYLNYQLSATPVNWRAVLMLMYPDSLVKVADELILETLIYLGEAYGQEKRILGPFAVLHPIRAASLLSRASGPVKILDLLTTLLHDKNEDITDAKYSPEDWKKLEALYGKLIRKINNIENWYLNERIHFLTRHTHESYLEYLVSLIDQAQTTPELIRVKLADRLDNTLDLRMDLYEDTSGANCYQFIFEALFTDTYREAELKNHHHTERKINGAVRLYQLFKNAIFLSLLRSQKTRLDKVAQQLFDSLAFASINEAQNIMLHIFAYHMPDTRKQKAVLLDVMDYCNKGGVSKITHDKSSQLDGLFKTYFDFQNKVELKDKLDILYRNKELMAEATVAFSAIFTNFLNNKKFTIEGITEDGIR